MRRLPFLLLILLAALVPARSAHAARGLEVALMDDGVFLNNGYQRYFDFDRALDESAKLKVTYIRTLVAWHSTMPAAQADAARVPKRIHYDWSLWDHLVQAAAARGIKVQMSLAGPVPAWAHPKHTPGVERPNAKLYGQFVAAAVKHFKGEVTRFSIWNEPNHTAWLKPLKDGPKLYRALFTAGYAAAKKANPKAQVLIGETAPYALKGRSTAPLWFLRGVACVNARYKRVGHCRTLKADGYATHPYDARHSPTYRFPGNDNVTIATLSRLTKALDKLKRTRALVPRTGRNLNLYLTEFAYLAFGPKRQVEPKRAKFLVQSFQIAERNPRVRQLVQYQLIQPDDAAHSFWQSYLLHTDGSPSLTYTKLLAWITGAAKKHQIAVPKAP